MRHLGTLSYRLQLVYVFHHQSTNVARFGAKWEGQRGRGSADDGRGVRGGAV